MSTILIIEDSAIVREPIEAVLAREGFNTLCATDGAEALSILARQVPDLILLDLLLPRVDGVAVLSHIQSNPKLRNVPVLVLSGQTDRHHITRIAKLGIAGYLLKSRFSLQQLLDKIRALLKNNTDFAESQDHNQSQPDSASSSPSVDSGAPAAEEVAGKDGVRSPSALAPTHALRRKPEPSSSSPRVPD